MIRFSISGAAILQETMLKVFGNRKELEHVNMEQGVQKAGLADVLPVEVCDPCVLSACAC